MVDAGTDKRRPGPGCGRQAGRAGYPNPVRLSSRRPKYAPPMKLNGTAAIISGGASGLGEATARALSEAGATVVVADLIEATGMSRRWVYYRLREHAEAGRAEQTERGTWRATPSPGGDPS